MRVPVFCAHFDGDITKYERKGHPRREEAFCVLYVERLPDSRGSPIFVRIQYSPLSTSRTSSIYLGLL